MMKISDYYQTISPDWPVRNVKVFTILNQDCNGKNVSFDSNSDLGNYNRRKLNSILSPHKTIKWINQIHSNKIIELPNNKLTEADGVFTMQKEICTITTADCLPIVFTNVSGTVIGIVHAGRQGLYENIIKEMIGRINVQSEELLVWIGPGIAKHNYEVSEKIESEFIAKNKHFADMFERSNNKIFLDLYKLAKYQLETEGVIVSNIYGAKWDTYSNNLLHSYRRDKEKSGRMVTVAWLC